MLTDDLKQTIRKNLVNFRHAVLQNGDKEVEPAPFHYRWSDLLLNGKGHICIEGFRQSAKTNYVLRAYPLYCLAYPDKDREYIVLVKNNATGATAKLKEIIAEYESNPLLMHNFVEFKEKSGNALSVDVLNEAGEVVNIRIEAYGKGSSIRGLLNRNRRPSLVILDDLQDVEDMRSDLVQETDFNWFISDVLFLGNETRIFMIANNLGAKCIAERVFDNAKDLGFHCERVPIEVGGVPTWPAFISMAEIEKEKESYKNIGKLDTWLRERQCIAVSDESRVFHKDDFRYFNREVLMKTQDNLSFYMTIDPATSKNAEADYSVCMVMAVDENNNWFVVDMQYGNWSSPELIDNIFNLVVQWKLNAIGIEKGILKLAIEPFILKEMTRRNIFFDITPLDHAGTAKVDRIKMIAPRFKAHSVWFAQDMPWLAELESELLAMTRDGSKGLRDDACDALAYMEKIATAPFRRGRGVQNLQRQAVMN